MAKQLKLTEKREKWVGNRSTNLKGKPLQANAGLEAAYYKKIKRILDMMANETSREVAKVLKSDAAKGFAMDASISSAFRVLFNKLTRKYDRVFAEHAKGYAEYLIRQSESQSKTTLGASLKQLSGGLSIKTDNMTPKLREVIKASVDENTSLIKSVGSDYMDKVRDDVMRSITATDTGGLTGLRDRIDKSLTSRYAQQRNKAKNVALDQTRKVYNNINAERMKSVGVTKFEWNHSGGSQNPREDHIKMDGNIYSFDDLPVIDRRTGERGIPGQAINCHPGDTLIDLRNGINKLYRRVYTGELIHLVSDNGVILKATPNHPILTDSGWKAAHLINEGDYIIEALDHSVDAGKAHVQDGESKFIDVFDAFAFYVGAEESFITSSGLEFHGDASDHEVDIVDINGFLPREFNVEVAEKFCKFILSRSDVYSEGLCSGDCSFAELIMSSLAVPDCLIGSFGSALSLLKSDSTGANDARLALVSDFNTMLNEPLSDCSSRDVVLLRKLELAKSGNVLSSNILCGQFLASAVLWLSSRDGESVIAETLGEIVRVNPENVGDSLKGSNPIKQRLRVVKKFSSEFSSHVYNLENKSNWYVANGIITHNCKCFMTPVIEFEDGEEAV